MFHNNKLKKCRSEYVFSLNNDKIRVLELLFVINSHLDSQVFFHTHCIVIPLLPFSNVIHVPFSSSATLTSFLELQRSSSQSVYYTNLDKLDTMSDQPLLSFAVFSKPTFSLCDSDSSDSRPVFHCLCHVAFVSGVADAICLPSSKFILTDVKR